MRKVRVGISFEPETVDALDEQVKSSPDLSPDRSEIANAIIKAFFRAGLDHQSKTRELLILARNGRLNRESVHNVHSQKTG
ncbi:MAG: hypothetical protein HYY67_09345 [Thaumarchaeota archaeon]|nr:hypothetical protein [Nitrososphaerota archaeon]